jgi:hypothetical protein
MTIPNMLAGVRRHWLIISIVAAALLVRLWGINHQIYTDEDKVVGPAIKMASSGSFPLLMSAGNRYPHFFANFISLVLWPWHALWPDTADLTYYTIARVLSALLGTATVALVYLAGTAAGGEGLAAMAAALAAFMPLHVKYSHYAHPDVPAAFWGAVVLVASLYILRTGRLRWYLLAGAATGAAAATHQWAICVGVAFMLAHGARWHLQDGTWRRFVGRQLVWALVLIPIAFAVISPHTLLEYKQNAQSYARINAHGQAGDLGNTRPDWLWPLLNTSQDWGIPFTSSGLLWETGPLVMLLAAVGIGIAIRQKNTAVAVVVGASLIILYFGISGYLRLYAIKRFVVLTPFIALAAGYTLEYIRRRPRGGVLTAGLLLATAIAFNAWSDGLFDGAYAGGSTYTAAVAWAKQHIPPGSVVLQHTPIKMLNWDDADYHTVRMDEVYANFNAADPEVSHDRAKPLDYWVGEKHVQYIAMDSRIVDRYFDPTSMREYPETTASYQAFYNDVRRRGNLIYRIEPQPWRLAGSRIEIYEVGHLPTAH